MSQHEQGQWVPFPGPEIGALVPPGAVAPPLSPTGEATARAMLQGNPLRALDPLLGAARGHVTRAGVPSLLNPVPSTFPELAGAVGGAVVPGGTLATGPLRRMVGAGAAQGLAELGASGGNVGAAGTAALTGAAGQGIGEAVGGLIRGPLNLMRYGRARAAHEKIITEQKAGYERAKTEAATDLEARRAAYDQAREAREQQHTRALEDYYRAKRQMGMEIQRRKVEAKSLFAERVREFNEQGGADLAAVYREKVPSWADIPATEAGLSRMVDGDGPAKLMDMFDRAIQDVKGRAQGQTVELPIEIVSRLAASARKRVKTLTLPEGLENLRPGETAPLSAVEVIEVITGMRDQPSTVYFSAADALDGLGFANVVARDEYRTGRALIEFAHRSGMVLNRQFNPEAARKALTMPRPQASLTSRKEGTAWEGPIAEIAYREGPLAPHPTLPVPPERPVQSPLGPAPRTRGVPEPVAPTAPKDQPGFKVRQFPNIPHPYSVGLLGGGLGGMALGMPQRHVWEAAAGLGGALGMLSGREVPTRVPTTGWEEALLRVMPALMNVWTQEIPRR